MPNTEVTQLHALYRIETKAQHHCYPFKLWLERQATQVPYQEKCLADFWCKNEGIIIHHSTIAPIFISKLEDIKKASKHIMSSYDVKYYAHQYQRHQWFRQIITEQIRLHLINYLTTDKIDQQT